MRSSDLTNSKCCLLKTDKNFFVLFKFDAKIIHKIVSEVQTVRSSKMATFKKVKNLYEICVRYTESNIVFNYIHMISGMI